MHKEVFKIAEYFTEELNYDRVPYSPLGMLSEEYKVLLFTKEALDKYRAEPMPYRIYGACFFIKMKFTDPAPWETFSRKRSNRNVLVSINKKREG